jgi:hypothetical protein
MYLFTDNSDKMLFQMMKNDHVVVVCAHCHLGPQRLHLELVICIALCVVVLSVDCCVTLGNAVPIVISVVCTVKKISPLEMKVFVHVIIVVAYVFNLFHVLTVVYNGGSCFSSRTFNIVSSFECVIVLVI